MQIGLRKIYAIFREVSLALLTLAFCYSNAQSEGLTINASNNSFIKISENEPLPAHRRVVIGISKSMMIELPRDIRDILVSSPKTLDAVMHTTRRAYLIGLETGQANAFFFDKDGTQVLTLEIVIERDLSAMSELFKRFIPGSNIKAEMLNDNVLLTGAVANPTDATRAADIAGRFVAQKDKVLNMISVAAKEQIMLKVTISEMNRDTIKRMGINWNTGGSSNGGVSSGTNHGYPFTTGTGTNSFLTGLFGANPAACAVRGTTAVAAGIPTGLDLASPFHCLSATMQALERNGLARVLAEPNLTAISGETAKFLAGGEFPIPVGYDNGQVTIEFKPFGVGLSFTPVVLSEGRISMKISTEVSELSSEAAIVIASISVPSLKVRRAETLVELPSGGSLVIAGLLSDETKQNIDGIPGLKNLPVLGSLFRSQDYKKKETELVVMVTPYVVNPTSRDQLATPDGNFSPATDRNRNLFGQLNKIYGRREEEMPSGGYKGDYGFIVE